MLKRRNKGEFSVYVFGILTSIILIIFIFLLALALGTTKRGIQTLTFKYIDKAQVDDTYFDNFIDNGFSYEQSMDFLSGENVKKCVSLVMSEQIYALFKNTSKYEYTKEDSRRDIEKALRDFMTENSITLSEEKIEMLINYTLDLSGINPMFEYESPSAYRLSVFSDNNSDLKDYEALFDILSVISSPIFLALISFLLVVCIVVMYFVGARNGRIVGIICNFFSYPSFFLVGISLGYILGADNGNILTHYCFSKLLFSSLLCFIATGIVLVMLKAKTPRTGNNDAFDVWLTRIKEKHQNKIG